MESGRSYQILTASWRFFEESGMEIVRAAVNDGAPETYSRKAVEYGYDPGTSEATVSVPIPDFFPSGTYWLNSISMRDVAQNWRTVYFTSPGYTLRTEDEVIDEAPQTIEVETTRPDITPPELDVNSITIQAEPTRPLDPNGETRVDITFRVRDNISGYHRSSLRLRDPQGVEHYYSHLHRDYYEIYHRGDPTAWEIQEKTITLPAGSIPGTWGLAEMTVEDKAQNILRPDFTEIVRFEVVDPDSQVTAHAIPQALLKVSGDEQSGPSWIRREGGILELRWPSRSSTATDASRWKRRSRTRPARRQLR